MLDCKERGSDGPAWSYAFISQANSRATQLGPSNAHSCATPHKVEDMTRSLKKVLSLIENWLRFMSPLGLAEKHRCDFAGCFHEVRVHRAEWLELRKYAHELDIDKGSYYDARIGVVNFWCGPDNKPLDWPDVEINKGTLKFPRDYVGAFWADNLRRRKITLHFCIHAYTRGEAAGVERMSPEYRRLLLGTEQDQKWVIRQFDLLQHHVALMRNGSFPEPAFDNLQYR